MDRLRRAAEMIKSTPYQNALKNEDFGRRQEKLSQINSVLMSLMNHDALESKEFPVLLSSSLEILFSNLDDEDSSVRLSADTTLIQAMKTLRENHSSRLLVELKKAIKQNQSPRVLKTALLRFAEMSHLIRPQKRRLFMQSLLYSIEMIAGREEEMVHESLTVFMSKIMPHLGSFILKTEVEVLVLTFANLLSSKSATIRRSAATSLALVVEHCYDPQLCLIPSVELTLDRLEFEVNPQDGLSAQTSPTLIGYLECLKALFKLKFPSEGLTELVMVRAYTILHQIIIRNDNSLTSALETLQALLRVGSVDRNELSSAGTDRYNESKGESETRDALLRDLPRLLSKIVSGEVVPMASRTSARSAASSCLVSCVEFGIGLEECWTLIEGVISDDDPEVQGLAVVLAGTLLCSNCIPVDRRESLLLVINKGLNSHSAGCLRSSLQALAKCVTSLLDGPRIELRGIFEALRRLSENQYWLVKCAVLDVIERLDFVKIFYLWEDEDIQNSLMRVVFDSLEDEDSRVRSAASNVLVRLVPKLFSSQPGCDSLLAVLVAYRNTKVRSSFPNLTGRVPELHPYFVPGEVHENTKRCLTDIIQELLLRVSIVDDKGAVEGLIQSLDDLSAAYPPCTYSSAWFNDAAVLSAVYELATSHPLAENVSVLSHLLTLAGRLLAGLAPFEHPSSSADSQFEKVRSGLLSTVMKILSVYHAVYEDSTSSYTPSKAATFPRQIVSPTRRRVSIRERDKSSDRKSPGAQFSGYFWSQTYFIRLYETVRSLWKNSRLSYENASEDKLLGLLRSSLDLLSLLCEISTSNQISRHYEEILVYLKSCTSFLPAPAVYAVTQLLKSLFGSTFLSELRQEDISSMKEVISRRESTESSIFGAVCSDPVVRNGRLLNQQKNVDKPLLTATIIHFEPIVKRALALYTTTSDTLVQIQIICLIKHLVTLGLNYNLLDPEQVFLKHLTQQLEFLQDGVMPSVGDFLKVIFVFLFTLCKAKTDLSKPVLAVTRAVQLWRNLVDNSRMRIFALSAGSPVIVALFNKDPRINAETESCRKSVVELLTKSPIDREVAELLLLILENQRESKSPDYRELSETAHSKLLDNGTQWLSTDQLLPELFDALDPDVFAGLPLTELNDLSAAANEGRVRCSHRLSVLIEETSHCAERDEVDLATLSESLKLIVDCLAFDLKAMGNTQTGSEHSRHLELICNQLGKIASLANKMYERRPLLLEEFRLSFHLLGSSFAKTKCLEVDSLIVEAARRTSAPWPKCHGVNKKGFYQDMCNVLLVLYMCEGQNTGLEDHSSLEPYLFSLSRAPSVSSCLEKLLSEDQLPVFASRIKEIGDRDSSFLHKVAVVLMDIYKGSRTKEFFDLISYIYSRVDLGLQRYIEYKVEQKFFLSLVSDESEAEAGSLLLKKIRRKKSSAKPSISSVQTLVKSAGFVKSPRFFDLQSLRTFLCTIASELTPSIVPSLCRTGLPLEFLIPVIEKALEGSLKVESVNDVLYVFDAVYSLGSESLDVQKLVKGCLLCLPVIFKELGSCHTADIIKPLDTTVKIISIALKLEMDSDLETHVDLMVEFLVSQLSGFYMIEKKAEKEDSVKEVLSIVTKDPVLKRLPYDLAVLCRKLLIVIVRTAFHSGVVAPQEDGDPRDNMRLSPSSVHVLQDEEVIGGFNERLETFGWKNRLGFEEYWMTYLSVLNANMSIDDLNTDEAKAIVKVTCEVVNGIVSLLLQSLLFPVPGNPAVSEYLHESREVPSAFLETREGEKLARLLKQLPLDMMLDRNMERMDSGISYSLNQVSVKFLTAAIQANAVSGTSDSPQGSVIVDSPVYVDYQTALQNSALDVKSCVHFLLDLYQQWFDQDMSFELRFQLVKSILPLSDLFCERSQYEWMYKVFFKLLKKYDGDEAVCLPYLWVGLAKCAAILPPESVHWDELRKQLSLAINTPFPKTQIYVVHGLLYVLQAPEGPFGNIVGTAADYFLRYLPNQVASVLSGSLSMAEEVLVWFSLGFYLAGYHRETIANFDVVGTVLNQAVTCLFSEKISSALRSSLIVGIYHLSMSGLSQTCYRLLGNYAKKSLKSSDSRVFTSGIQLLLISYYTGICFCSNQDETDEINLLAMECIGDLFDRLKIGLTSEAGYVASFLGHWLCEVLSLDMALNRAICEFSVVDDSRRFEMAEVLRKVFAFALESGQKQKAFDWVCFGSDSLLKKNSLWYITCALILSSPNEVVRNIDVRNLRENCDEEFRLVVEEFRSEETEEQIARLLELASSRLKPN